MPRSYFLTFLDRVLWAGLVIGLIIWLWVMIQPPVSYSPRPKLKPAPVILHNQVVATDPVPRPFMLRLDTMWYIISEYDAMANELNDLHDIRVARILHAHLKKIDRARRKAWPKQQKEMK